MCAGIVTILAPEGTELSYGSQADGRKPTDRSFQGVERSDPVEHHRPDVTGGRVGMYHTGGHAPGVEANHLLSHQDFAECGLDQHTQSGTQLLLFAAPRRDPRSAGRAVGAGTYAQAGGRHAERVSTDGSP